LTFSSASATTGGESVRKLAGRSEAGSEAVTIHREADLAPSGGFVPVSCEVRPLIHSRPLLDYLLRPLRHESKVAAQSFKASAK
jgi:hypothetical protein